MPYELLVLLPQGFPVRSHAFCWLLLMASGQDTKPSSDYQESGTVLSSISKHEHFYQVATEVASPTFDQ